VTRYRASLGEIVVEFESPWGDGFALDEGAVELRMAGALPAPGSLITTRLDTRTIGLDGWANYGTGRHEGRVFSRSGMFEPTDFRVEVVQGGA